MADRPRKHELETESERELRNVLPVAWVIRDLTKGDYGVDCEVEVFENGSMTGLTFKVQLKGTDSTRPTRTIPLRKFQYWHSLDVPVLLALWQSKTAKLRGLWTHAHDPGRLKPDQQTTTVRFEPEHELKDWLDQIPDQLRLIRSIRRGTITFPLPLRIDAASPGVVALLHAALREVLTSRDLEDVFTVEPEAMNALTATLTSTLLRVALPLDIRSINAHGPRGSMTRDPAITASTAFDIVAMAAMLLAPIGTGERAAKVLARTIADSSVFNLDNGEELLAQVATTLRDTGDQEALVKLIEFVSNEPHLRGTLGEGVALSAATSAPLETDRAKRVAAVLQRRSKDLRDEDPGLSARYLFNAGQTLLHNHLRPEGLACLEELETFSSLYAREPQFYKARGQGRWWTGDLEGAVADYQEAWDLGLRTPGLVDNLSDALMTAGRYAEALGIASSPGEEGHAEDPVVLRRVILRDIIDLTGLEQQQREFVDADEREKLAESDDAEAIHAFLVQRDALVPPLMSKLAALQDGPQAGAAILLATWNEEFALLWVHALMAAIACDEDRGVIEALSRRGVTASSEFLGAVADMFEDARANLPEGANWDELEEWVFASAASAKPFKKGGLQPLRGPENDELRAGD
ncbi:MAG: hypothetical protein JWR52_1067 [Marmoricola sp.]|nr:hypothetical protein [Marmoricola sp.]